MSAQRKRDICSRFGKAVRRRRVELGISQEALAAAASLNRTYTGDIERGARNISLRNIEKLTKALHVDMSDFFSEYGVEI